MTPVEIKNESRRICLITPCRNEARFAPRTIDSVLRQSILPTLWIIVDDGSTDDTRRILEKYSERVPFLRVIHRNDRGCRQVGAGVIDTFNAGLSVVNLRDFDYVCKLDLDLVLPDQYFQHLIEWMESNPRLGTCSGKPYYRTSGGQLVPEDCGAENSIGASKFYRRECFEEIGGFETRLMWDGIDCHRCRMLGWIAASSDHPGVRFEHLRPMGSSHKTIWHGRKRHGEGQYSMGTGPVYLLASALYRLGSRPPIFGSLAMLWGYFSAALRAAPRYEDHEFRQYLRRYQRRALVAGKNRTVQEISDATEVVWRSRYARCDAAPTLTNAVHDRPKVAHHLHTTPSASGLTREHAALNSDSVPCGAKH